MAAVEYETWLRAFHGNIKRIRKSTGLSQEAAADAAGLSRVMVGYIEQGRREPSLESLYSLAKTYGVPVSDFFAV